MTKGQTTTEENFKVERFFWQRYLVQEEPDPKVLVEIMHCNSPLNHVVSFVDIRNRHNEDSLRSAKFIESAQRIKTLLSGLGFSSAVDRDKIDKDTFIENWCANIVGKPKFQSKLLNAILSLTKRQRITTVMTTRQKLSG